MPNTQAIGVAYADPQFDSVVVTGNIATGSLSTPGTIGAASLSATSGVSAASAAISGAITGGSVTSATIASTGDLYIKSATVAAAGGNQGAAALVAGGFTLVSGADDSKGVRLPLAAAGRTVIIKNNTSGKTLKIYPATSDAINALSANASYDIAGLTAVMLIAYDDTTWYSMPLVAS